MCVCECAPPLGTCQPISLISWVRGLHGVAKYLFTSRTNTVVSQHISSPGEGGGAKEGAAHFMRRKSETYGKRTGEESVRVYICEGESVEGRVRRQQNVHIGARGCQKKVFGVKVLEMERADSGL